MAKGEITLKQVLNKIKDMDEKHKVEWVYSLLKEFGSEVTSKLYHEGYEQGKFDEAIKSSTPQVEIPDYVGYWLEYCKATNVGMINATYVSQCHLNNYARMSDADKLRTYFVSDKNQENFLNACYKRVIAYSDYTLELGDHNYMSLDKLKQHSRQACYQITEDMIKESSLSWAWQFAKELEDY